jgi:phytoene synthase
LRSFGLHAARRQLYVPLEILDRHRVSREDIFAAQGSERLLAALAEMRGLARQHLAAAQTKLESVASEILPAFLPVALVGPQLCRMERPGYQPFALQQISPWRRQWQLWRAARDPSRIFQA